LKVIRVTEKKQAIDLSERQRRKLRLELERMQYMWIAPDRMNEKDIKRLSLDDLLYQHRLHSDLWAEYPNKPEVPHLCIKCKKETSENEILMVMNSHSRFIHHSKIWYHRECQDCFYRRMEEEKHGY
jgi:uncharacterized protein (DUF1919 family)